AAAVFFFMKWKDLDDRAAFAEAEKERAKRIAGHGEGRRTAPEGRVQRTSRDREPVRREGAERRRPAEGAARNPEGRTGERPARPAGERRPVDVQKGQSSHTVRPSDPQERRAEAPVREAAPREERPAAPAETEAERRPHRPRPQADVPVKEHHRKPPVDDDDDEFEFGFLNWDDDDK
ncbi:MAG: hypothetical protein J6W48_10835, partial [Lachnospiraceae bacterium]|nr:hypothetical protein [Lachnospiraceae bacterium]